MFRQHMQRAVNIMKLRMLNLPMVLAILAGCTKDTDFDDAFDDTGSTAGEEEEVAPGCSG